MRCESCVHFPASMPVDKLIEELSVKLTEPQKRQLVQLAEIEGLTASELVRRLIASHLAERGRYFKAMESIFGVSLPSDKE